MNTHIGTVHEYASCHITQLVVADKEDAVGTKPRWIVANRVYEMTIRTTDRCFLFTPNHGAHPLLDAGSPPKSLDIRNDVVPKPSIINIIGAAVGRALDRHTIRIHAIECNANHIHIVFSVTEEQFVNLVPFFRDMLSTVARKTNRVWDREGPVFGGRGRSHPCITDQAATHQLLYSLTNVAKDHLIEKTAQTPFFTTYHHQAKGKPLKYWYIDYTAYYTAGGKRKKSHRLKDYLRWVEWRTTPLPEHEKMTESQRQTWIRKQVKAYEQRYADERKREGRSVFGLKRLFQNDPRDRPAIPKKSGKEPLCHSSDPEMAKSFKGEWKQFMDQYISASADYRCGMKDREFPEGSFKPPLFDIAKAIP